MIVTDAMTGHSVPWNNLSEKSEQEFRSDYLKRQMHAAFSQPQIQRLFRRHGIAISESLAIVHRLNAEGSAIHCSR
jgi:hypothetical protein